MKLAEQNNLETMLREGIRELSLDLNEVQMGKLLDFLSLLKKWNAVYNLTAVREPEQMVKQHLLDCLAALPAFQGAKNVLDVGAGGGLPGIVLAIAYPEMHVSLIDTVQKKTAFLTQAKVELGLSNVTVLTGRVERLETTEKFDVITSRAFAELEDFVQLTQHLLNDNIKDKARYIAMKGALPQKEMDNLPTGWCVSEIRPLKVPGLQAERHLIMMERGQT